MNGEKSLSQPIYASPMPEYRGMVAALRLLKGTRDDHDHPGTMQGTHPLLSELLLDQERIEPTDNPKKHRQVAAQRGVPK